MRSTPSARRIGFTPAQTRRVFDAARALGLPVKLHAEQLSDQGGAALAAGYGALSLRPPRVPVGDDGVRRDGARPAPSRCCCPARSTSCARRRLPPVAALRDAGVPIAIATDHNPGSSPALSLLLMLNMACTLFRLTPEEALRGVTVHAARALGLHDRGTLAAGQRADFVVWDARASERARLLVRPQPVPRASSSAGARTVSDERRRLHAAPRHDAAARQPAARRHRDPGRLARAAACRARCDVEDTDWHLDRLYAFARELGASLLRAALLALRRST